VGHVATEPVARLMVTHKREGGRETLIAFVREKRR